MSIRILEGECVQVMKTLPDCSVDAVVTDPPYGIRFMGQAWDGADIEHRYMTRSAKPDARRRNGMAAAAGQYDLSPAAMLAFQEFSETWARQALRVLKPGGHLLSFSSPRTYHRMACGIEQAGFELFDQIMWVFGSGFPKSHNGEWGGTALKPAHEPIAVARKPREGTIASNWRAHGTGALNIDRCRVFPESVAEVQAQQQHGAEYSAGRWPANLLHDGSDEVLAAFPRASGQRANLSATAPSEKTSNCYSRMRRDGEASAVSENEGVVGFKMKAGARRLDAGSAARFFYCAKADRADRNEGLGDPGPQFKKGSTMRDAENVGRARKGNFHPTVKPTDLMRYLCRLVTPAGGVILDPFMGSGSTLKAAELEGFSAVGIEIDPDYVQIARQRIAADAPLFAEVA